MLSIFSLGFDHLIHDSCFTVPLTGPLGVSHEKHPWRIGLFYFHLLAGYRNFCNSTSIFFHGYISLHLPFKWWSSFKIQSESHSEYIFFLQEFRTRIPVGKADHFSFYKSNTELSNFPSQLVLNDLQQDMNVSYFRNFRFLQGSWSCWIYSCHFFQFYSSLMRLVP